MAVAVTVTEVLAVTVEAVTVKAAEVAPAATVTEEGVVRAELLSERVTTWPPVGAAEERAAVQVEDPPEEMEVGEQERDETVGRTVVVEVTAPFEAVAVSEPPDGEVARTVGAERTRVAVVEEVSRRLTVASGPVGSAVELGPMSRQV